MLVADQMRGHDIARRTVDAFCGLEITGSGIAASEREIRTRSLGRADVEALLETADANSIGVIRGLRRICVAMDDVGVPAAVRDILSGGVVLATGVAQSRIAG